ncbi:MAG TPA: vWA domain-containing protein [Nitrosopumilaceae archaeon]|nr:vWA domain-containing protein [Nitrosopumilaceae archaeon]
MKDTFNDITRQIFYDVAQKDQRDVDIVLSNKKDFPYFINKERMVAVIPIPRLINERFFLQGFTFNDYENQQEVLWSQYLASVYHLGAHIAISNFDLYKGWTRTKTQEYATKVIDFIEDFRAECYLKENFPAPAQIIEDLDQKYYAYFKKIFSGKDDSAKKRFSDAFNAGEGNVLSQIKNKLLENINDSENLLECAEITYENRHLLNPLVLPYRDRIDEFNSSEIFQPISFKPQGDFQKTCILLGETWVKEITRRRRALKKYKQLSRDLRFDEIEYAQENFSEFLRLESQTGEMVKKIKSRLKMISNVVDSPRTDEIGILEMQKAIQAIASQNPDVQVFEQDEARRVSESWAIILDSSASMSGQFNDLKKFTLCLSEAAEEINSDSGNWSLSAFNNNFYVVKDSGEGYSQQTKSRFGGIESQGLSFIPDAIILTARTLAQDQNEKKYIFLVSDGQTLGYNDADDYFKEAIGVAKSAGVNVVGIGVKDSKSKLFTASFGYEEIGRTVSKFIRAYIAVAEEQM